MRKPPPGPPAHVGGNRRIETPALTIKVLRVVPQNRNVVQTTMGMSPAGILAFCGKEKLHQAVIGRLHGAEILLIGDTSVQSATLATQEVTWTVRNDQGRWGPVMHGVGAIVGMAPVHRKAINVPVDAAWLVERIRWNVTEGDL